MPPATDPDEVCPPREHDLAWSDDALAFVCRHCGVRSEDISDFDGRS